MLRRIIILDIALVAVLVLGGMKLYQDWYAFAPLHDVSAIQPQPDAFPALPLSNTSASPAGGDWTEIPSRNPFSFDRNDIAIVAQQLTPVDSGPKPVLFGIMSLGGPRLAMLAPGRPPGNRSSIPRKSGETIDGWTIVQIDEKSVVVESRGVRETILMNDPTAQVPREHRTETAVASPVVIQSAAPAASTPTPSAAPSANNGSTTANPAPGQPRMRVIQTPFGTVRQVIEEDPQQ